MAKKYISKWQKVIFRNGKKVYVEMAKKYILKW